MVYDINELRSRVDDYFCGTLSKTAQDTLINKLVEYLDCYIGVRNFNIVVSYRDGAPDMLLLV